MKNFEILQELPKCDTKTRSEQMLLEKLCQQTYSTEGRHRPSIYLKKNEICVKHNKAKHNKTRCGLFRGHFTETQQIPIGLPWWVRLRTCNAGNAGYIPGRGLRSYTSHCMAKKREREFERKIWQLHKTVNKRLRSKISYTGLNELMNLVIIFYDSSLNYYWLFIGVFQIQGNFFC